MSRENIPAFDCRECKDFAVCTELCQDARQYINQDCRSLSRREILTDKAIRDSLDYKDDLHTKMRQIERISKITPRDKAILRMKVAGIARKVISEMYGISIGRVDKIISYYRGK